jgi:hypothetical protein
MKKAFDKIALGITADEVPLGSHLIHLEDARGIRVRSSLSAAWNSGRVPILCAVRAQ